MTKTIKSVFAFCFSLLMISLSLMPAFAADVQLTDGNIAEYPTIEGEIYFTQKVGDCLTLSGGKVTIDGSAEGEEIPGHFEFLDPNFTPTSTVTAQRASIKFIPENEDLYSTIEVKNSRNLRFYAKEAPMVLEDSSELVTAVLDEPGALSNAKINEVPVICTLSGETVVGAKWNWNVSAQVEKNGFYEARITKTGYTPFVVDVYVKVAGDESEPSVKKFPTIEPTTWYEGLTAGDLKLEGGEKTVPGDFSISEPDRVLNAGAYYLKIIFTPKDESQQSISKIIPVTILQADASFIDENGEPIVPVLNWNIGSRYAFSNLRNTLEYYYPANCGTFKIGSFTKMLPLDESRNYYDTSTPGTYDCVASLKSQANTNYTNTLKFKIKVDKKVVTPRITRYINTDELIIDGVDYPDYRGIRGTFKVYVNGELIKSTENGVTYLTGFKWRPAKSGTYKLKAEYTPADDDICAITENVIEQDVTVALKWTVKGENVNFTSTTAQYGTNVTVLQRLGDNFNGWEFYDENGKKYANPEKELGMRYDPTVPSTVNFTMPDHDITVKAIDKTQSNLPGGDGNFSDFFSSFLAWLNNLLARFRALMDAVAQLLTVVG